MLVSAEGKYTSRKRGEMYRNVSRFGGTKDSSKEKRAESERLRGSVMSSYNVARTPVFRLEQRHYSCFIKAIVSV